MNNMHAINTALADRYKIVHELGRGAMGIVYFGNDVVVDRPVAIKVFPKNRISKKRFEIETRAISRLSHPNILPMEDSGELEGFFFYVSPYIEGKALSDIIKDKAPLPVRDALIVSEQVASALAYAHARRIIHRDIKPSNIILAQDGRVFLTDFGVMGLLEPDSNSTQAGEIFGTPIYMAPEQILGKPQTIATDIYGLGMLLYEMLYGKPPFRAENVVTLLSQIVQAPITLPGEPAVPEALGAFIRKCLHKDPDQRPVSPLSEIEELREELTDPHPKPLAAPQRSFVGWFMIGTVFLIAISRKPRCQTYTFDKAVWS